jgi:aerobic carbon-monoxide dehydrogenase medium subunit
VKPAPFEYHRPRSVREAVSLIGSEQGFVKILAGGQSLGPMLNMRLAQPDALIDVTGIEELKSVTEEAGELRIGACLTHADIEDGRVPDVTRGLMPHVARNIAYRAVRNRGTIGGSLGHADPAADWMSALPLLGARVEIRSPSVRRLVAVEDLMTSSFATVLGPEEMIGAIVVARLSARARWGFRKFSRKAGEFGHAIGGVLHDPERGVFRAVMGAIDAAPIVVADATALFGGAFGPGLAERLDRQIVEALLSERGVSDPYDRQLHVAMLKRAASDASAP